jgi:hypothetical protein
MMYRWSCNTCWISQSSFFAVVSRRKWRTEDELTKWTFKIRQEACEMGRPIHCSRTIGLLVSSYHYNFWKEKKSWSKKLKGKERVGGWSVKWPKNEWRKKNKKKKTFLVTLLCVINRPSKLNPLLFPFGKGKCAPLITT